VVFRQLVDPPQADLILAWNPARVSVLRDAFLRIAGEEDVELS
jgi:hypothetical protein